MFEMIGLLFATGLLFALATMAGLMLALFVWLLVRKRNLPRKSLMAVAFLIPIASAAHLWLCKALLPGQTLFGDISQPLPNGYFLQALGKMPDFASISHAPLPYNADTGLAEGIGTIAVDGPLAVGRYSHPFDSFDPLPNEPYFLFDTRTSRHSDFASRTALEQALGHPVHLEKVELFRSEEPSYILQQRRENFIMFGPPILVTALFCLVVATLSIVSARTVL